MNIEPALVVKGETPQVLDHCLHHDLVMLQLLWRFLLIYTNKTGDCLSVCLFVYLFGYGRPNRKAYRAEIWRIDVTSPDDEYGIGAVDLKRHLR